MTEDELLAGITDALTLAGWTWTHIRRSDGITMGNAGLPDIIAVHPVRQTMLLWELKADRGRVTTDQLRWLIGGAASIVDARIVKPDEYDEALAIILALR